MRRRAVLERAVEAAEALFDRRAVEADHLERLDHRLRQMVADAARRDLEAVADHVVLERLDGQRVLAGQRLDAALRHRERVVGEVDLLLFLVPFEEREVDDPAELEPVAVDEVQFLAGARCAQRPRTCTNFFGSPATKKQASPSARPSCVRIASVRSSPMFLASGPAPSSFVAFLAPEDVAEPRLALALRPGSSCGRRKRGCRRSWPGSPRPRPSDRWPGCWRTP